VLGESEIAPVVMETRGHCERALEIYERLGDRTGVMSTVILMAYLNYAPTIHLTSSARHLEEIRRVIARQQDLVTESERARQELHMLMGVHVYARAKVVPDLALSRGEEAYRAARIDGDQSTEFSAATGVALTHLGLGEVEEADRWLDVAAPLAASSPTPLRTRQLELMRGRVRALADDPAAMRRHFEQARTLASRAGAAGRCETAAWVALTTARLAGRTHHDAEPLLTLAEEAADLATGIAATLPGHSPWLAYADAAKAEIALARGDAETAAAAGGAVMQALQDAVTEDSHLEAVLSASRAILAGAPAEMHEPVRGWLRLTLSRIAQATIDDRVRVRWLRSPLGRELVDLAGAFEPAVAGGVAGTSATAMGALDDTDRRIAKLLTEGQTNSEMAAELGMSETELAQRLGRVYAGLGASSRAEATTLAFRGMGGTASLVAATGDRAAAPAAVR
jgi:DNA-binding NarL/FixJ family response regulator